MTVPLLSTRTTNVELTPKRRDLLKTKLFPLCRYLGDTSIAYFDVVIRKEHSKSSGDQFHVSVKLSTPDSRYISDSHATHLQRAIIETRDALKRQLREKRARDRQIAPHWSFDAVQIA